MQFSDKNNVLITKDYLFQFVDGSVADLREVRGLRAPLQTLPGEPGRSTFEFQFKGTDKVYLGPANDYQKFKTAWLSCV